ncbi:hypothetical protein ILUMI_25777 [Ignelater luminosus]|uniref:Uncharacterized protein n=1 Tax=Ignelater luminosus TaxID=2038154 RepID=A0A8K0FZR0_IGNLU|nr:hypothetical protein ILUMI_25777 [Ignelater luminosus]
MAGSITALIISTVLSLNQSRHDTPVEPAIEKIISKFSQDANEFLNALSHFCKIAPQGLSQTRTNYLTAPTSSKQPEKHNIKSINSGQTKIGHKMDTNSNSEVKSNSNKYSTEDQEETGRVCVIEEEISEVSDYTLDPITNKIKISTVEEYSKLATCTVIKNQGIQAYDHKEEEEDDEEVCSNQQVDNQNEKDHLEVPDETEVNLEEADKLDIEPCEEITVESSDDTPQKESTPLKDKQSAEVLFENNLSQGVKHENEKIFPESSDTSLSEGTEVMLIKKLTDALAELKSKSVKVENEDLSSEISETSLSVGLEETIFKKITETFSTIKEVEEAPNQNEKVAAGGSETLMSPTIEETILKRLTETLSELKPKQLSTSNISINTIEKFPEPVETTDRAIEVEPEPINVSTQNTQTIENAPYKQNNSNVQNIEVKLNVKKNNVTHEVPTNKANNAVKRDKSKEPTDKIPPKWRNGAGAIEEFEKLIPKPRTFNKKEQKPKPQIKPVNAVEENKRRIFSKSRPPAKQLK